MPTRQRITEQIDELPSGPVAIVGQTSTGAPRRKILGLSLYSGLLENSCTAQVSVSHMIAPSVSGIAEPFVDWADYLRSWRSSVKHQLVDTSGLLPSAYHLRKGILLGEVLIIQAYCFGQVKTTIEKCTKSSISDTTFG